MNSDFQQSSFSSVFDENELFVCQTETIKTEKVYTMYKIKPSDTSYRQELSIESETFDSVNSTEYTEENRIYDLSSAINILDESSHCIKDLE